ncbi:Chromosome-partitioning protein Spo0J [Saezia sanguinis]|uniref:Chromosome-partitioning protein Spo0J n=1 Tax=Saezia sanguinis TaxID=1965230 RepID=A0A433SD90_9BURK|nr:plasmid partitioning protein RepB C-terminal domain-containing protein [Saezia sanguinis]RUS66701.1 Chromosome-partitioning protein Spo0J [Saezia sanguinis]
MNAPLTSRDQVELVSIAQIHILNPRSRSKKTHKELIEHIQKVGLKRPITVSRRNQSVQNNLKYDLVCGQGRLEAFLALQQTEIPAFVIDASEEDCLVMSLVENIARRQHRPIDLMKEIGRLRDRGHSDSHIAELIGVTASWVNTISGLLERGEEKLLAAVETGLIPISMATDIAKSSESEIQSLLADAYEQGFRGKKLITLRHLLESRAQKDKLIRVNSIGTGSQKKKKKMTAADFRRLFEQEAGRQQLMIKKATYTHDRVVFSIQALKELLSINSFMQLLKREQLSSMPKLIQTRLQQMKGI